MFWINFIERFSDHITTHMNLQTWIMFDQYFEENDICEFLKYKYTRWTSL